MPPPMSNRVKRMIKVPSTRAAPSSSLKSLLNNMSVTDNSFGVRDSEFDRAP